MTEGLSAETTIILESCFFRICLLAMEVYCCIVYSFAEEISNQQTALDEAKVFLILPGHSTGLERCWIEGQFLCKLANFPALCKWIKGCRTSCAPAFLLVHTLPSCYESLEWMSSIEPLATCLALVCAPFVCLYTCRMHTATAYDITGGFLHCWAVSTVCWIDWWKPYFYSHSYIEF